MLNDKLIIKLATYYIKHVKDLQDKSSAFYLSFKEDYPNLEILDIHKDYLSSHLRILTLLDSESKDVAIIFDGSNSIDSLFYNNISSFFAKSNDVYDKALKYYEHKEKEGYRIAYLAGNSLGAGAAQYIGSKYPIVRTLCINATPLQKKVSIDTKNIIHIRDNSDPLYRVALLDKELYDTGYVGNLLTINRSLYGFSDYYNHLELSHYGCIPFPDNFLNNKYDKSQEDLLKNVMDDFSYNYYQLLKKAPSLAEYIPFDLLSDNILKLDSTPPSFSFDEVQDNFAQKVKEISSSLQDYILPLGQLKNTYEFINFDSILDNHLRAILNYSLLPITKQHEKLLLTTQFVIDKSTPHIFKELSERISLISKDFDLEHLGMDKNKIDNDLRINKEAISLIIDALVKLNNDLYDYENFKLKNVFKVKNNLLFKYRSTPYKIDYKNKLIGKIEKDIKSLILENKSFKQVENFIYTDYKQGRVKLDYDFDIPKTDDKDQEIAYIKGRYKIIDKIERGLDIFMPDFIEQILNKSALYSYDVTITNINEQLEYVLITLDNLETYFNQVDISNNNKKHLHALIINLNNYINELIEYNKQSLFSRKPNL